MSGRLHGPLKGATGLSTATEPPSKAELYMAPAVSSLPVCGYQAVSLWSAGRKPPAIPPAYRAPDDVRMAERMQESEGRVIALS